jgi:uronate dehydrogenase
MKRVLLTGINGTVAQVMKKELEHKYEFSGLSIARMDQVLEGEKPTSWKQQLDSYCQVLTAQLETACQGMDAVVHLGWNTRDENWKGGLDPLNIAVVDRVYRVAAAQGVGRIYMASSVHAYDFMGDGYDPAEAIPSQPDTRQDPFGASVTSLYGVSKRWMEIAGQLYAERLREGQKILVVRLGAVGAQERPRRPSRLWDSHRDCAGLLEAFIECKDAPNFYITYGVSDNRSAEHPEPLFDWANPYGFKPADNSFELADPGVESRF